MMSKNLISGILIAVFVGSSLLLSGCVNQHPEGKGKTSYEEGSVETMLEITDPVEKKAVEIAKAKVKTMGEEPKVIATSAATAAICERLDLNLTGVCSTTISKIPKRYESLPTVGTAMAPDMEVIASLSPDWILSPASLQTDLQPKYEEIGTDWAFLNLGSVPGMYRSIQELGEIFGREKQADEMVREFTQFYEEYRKKNEGKEHPKVLILMGFPGSYIIATENSYVGSLVELAGGENVYAGTDQEFLTVNTEDMKTKEPDIILRTAHALPDQVVAMFKEDFEKNDIWKHFQAVEEGRVFDLTYSNFGMSATFSYPDALEELQPMLYPESEEDVKKAKDNSNRAKDAAEKSDATKKHEERMKE